MKPSFNKFFVLYCYWIVALAFFASNALGDEITGAVTRVLDGRGKPQANGGLIGPRVLVRQLVVGSQEGRPIRDGWRRRESVFIQIAILPRAPSEAFQYRGHLESTGIMTSVPSMCRILQDCVRSSSAW